MCHICSNYTKKGCDELPKMIENICCIWISINNKISSTINNRCIFILICWFLFCQTNFHHIRGREKNWNMIIGCNELTLSRFILVQKMWTKISKDNSYRKINNQLLHGFNDTTVVTRWHITIANGLIRLDIPIGQSNRGINLKYVWSMIDLLILKMKVPEWKKKWDKNKNIQSRR